MDLILYMAVGLAGLPVVVLLVEVLAALAPRRETAVPGSRGPVAVLIPAHDEASVIGATLTDLMPQLLAGDRVLVVADNCADDTAAIARACGAEVVERVDSARRGKGYALDFGRRHLASQPPAVVVVVDADCRVHPGSIDHLARMVLGTGRPTQATYLMHVPLGGGIQARVGEFAWVVKNQVRPLGLTRLGLPCQLMGAGMAFPWQALRAVDLASGHLVEDIKLGLDLARAGHAPLFCPKALVTSEFPSDAGARGVQRTRWEHGHLGTILAEAPGLLWLGLRRRDGYLLAMALDLAVPPLAFLALLVVAVTLVAGMAALGGASAAPLGLAIGVLIALVGILSVAWVRWGRGIVHFRELIAVPFYALSKIPIYVSFLVHRQTEWIRTRRD